MLHQPVANARQGAHTIPGGQRGCDQRSSVSPVQVRTAMWARSRRREFLNSELFADPAWDMLLELFCVTLQQQRISVSSLCGASGVPDTTALRWIKKLEQEGLAVRRPDPRDARRVFIELTAEGETAMQRYFEGLPPNVVAL